MRSLAEIKYMNNLAFARYLLENLEEKLGYTLNGRMLEIKNYSDGYQVSVKDMFKIPFKGLTPKALLDKYLLPMVEENDEGLDIGLWLDEGFVYIDFSTNIKNMQEAFRVGQMYNQLSIYDWANDSFHSVPKPKPRPRP